MNKRAATIGKIVIGEGEPLVLIAGPCVIESEEMVLDEADRLKTIAQRLSVPFIFKASYDKANRSSIDSFRGPGLKKGLDILRKVRENVGVPVLSDIHSADEARPAADVLDVLQIPAFLCRQTDIIVASARTGKPLNIKKGQFLEPQGVANIAKKCASAGNTNIFFTERGTCFGYNNLVSDMRSIPIIQSLGYPVVFDATHSVQLPGGAGTASSGERQFVAPLAKAAVAAGADGIFLEVHERPGEALCDGPNMLSIDELEYLLRKLKMIREISGV
jgi:2-dehydro-3-deoxyphosphooctonate aldolase (KDO 8-P synthase)